MFVIDGEIRVEVDHIEIKNLLLRRIWVLLELEERHRTEFEHNRTIVVISSCQDVYQTQLISFLHEQMVAVGSVAMDSSVPLDDLTSTRSTDRGSQSEPKIVIFARTMALNNIYSEYSD